MRLGVPCRREVGYCTETSNACFKTTEEGRKSINLCHLSATPPPLCRFLVERLHGCMQFVSRFTENKMDGEKLERVYHKIKTGKATAAAVHSIGAGTSGNFIKSCFLSPFLEVTVFDSSTPILGKGSQHFTVSLAKLISIQNMSRRL